MIDLHAPTVRAIANCLDAEAAARLKESDDARSKTGTFEHLKLPTVDDEVDLDGIVLANQVIANAFAELAVKLRNLV